MSYRNRLANAKNPYQGTAKKVLCVCSAGLLRSPTAANVLHREFGHNTRAAGIAHDFALIVVDDVLVAWADEVVCMDNMTEVLLEDMIDDDTKLINLDIDDNFDYMDDTLQRLIIDRYLDHA